MVMVYFVESCLLLNRFLVTEIKLNPTVWIKLEQHSEQKIMSTSFVWLLQFWNQFPSFGHICICGSKISISLEVYKPLIQTAGNNIFMNSCIHFNMKGLKTFGWTFKLWRMIWHCQTISLGFPNIWNFYMTISIMSGNLSPLLNRYFVCHMRLVLVL